MRRRIIDYLKSYYSLSSIILFQMQELRLSKPVHVHSFVTLRNLYVSIRKLVIIILNSLQVSMISLSFILLNYTKMILTTLQFNIPVIGNKRRRVPPDSKIHCARYCRSNKRDRHVDIHLSET